MNITAFKQNLLKELYEPYSNLSELSIDTQGATQIVFGQGNANAQIMIIGEAPGQQEDVQGIPFVGRSGALLNKALEEQGFSRAEVFVTNVVKCRPPNNRTPTSEEIEFYSNLFLKSEISIVQPKVILLLGAVALLAILNKKGISKLRGTFFALNSIKVLPTYHPAYILRNPEAFAYFCQDVKKLKEAL